MSVCLDLFFIFVTCIFFLFFPSFFFFFFLFCLVFWGVEGHICLALLLWICLPLLLYYPQWDTVDTEIKVFSVENSELRTALPLKPGVGENIAIRASCTARNFVFSLISIFPVHSSSFFKILFLHKLDTLLIQWLVLIYPEMTLCMWQDVKIQELTLSLLLCSVDTHLLFFVVSTLFFHFLLSFCLIISFHFIALI